MHALEYMLRVTSLPLSYLDRHGCMHGHNDKASEERRLARG